MNSVWLMISSESSLGVSPNARFRATPARKAPMMPSMPIHSATCAAIAMTTSMISARADFVVPISASICLAIQLKPMSTRRHVEGEPQDLDQHALGIEAGEVDRQAHGQHEDRQQVGEHGGAHVGHHRFAAHQARLLDDRQAEQRVRGQQPRRSRRRRSVDSQAPPPWRLPARRDRRRSARQRSRPCAGRG